LAKLNVAEPDLFKADTLWPYFEQLRREAPVHYCEEHMFGPYWSVTKYEDIVAVNSNFENVSSTASITIRTGGSKCGSADVHGHNSGGCGDRARRRP
jgi:hypothetical protein